MKRTNPKYVVHITKDYIEDFYSTAEPEEQKWIDERRKYWENQSTNSVSPVLVAHSSFRKEFAARYFPNIPYSPEVI